MHVWVRAWHVCAVCVRGMCVCVCVHVLTCVHVHVCVHVCVCVCVRVSCHISVYVLTHVCMYACMHARTHARTHLCMYAYIHVHRYTCVHTRRYVASRRTEDAQRQGKGARLATSPDKSADMMADGQDLDADQVTDPLDAQEALGVWHADEVGACLGLLRLLAMLRSLKHLAWRHAREAPLVSSGQRVMVLWLSAVTAAMPCLACCLRLCRALLLSQRAACATD